MNGSSPQRKPSFKLPTVACVTVGRPFYWLRAGWKDLRANLVTSLIYGLLFAAGGDALLILSWQNPYLFSVAISSFFLLAPILAGGLYEISRRQEQGLSTTFFESLASGRRNMQSLAMFGLVLALASIIWERTSTVVFAIIVPGVKPELKSFILDVLLNFDYIGLTSVWFVVGACLALLVYSVSTISVPLMLDRDTDFVVAMLTSLRTVIRNPGAMLVWAALIVAFTLLGFSSLLFGLIFLIPLIGHATWHAYRDLIS